MATYKRPVEITRRHGNAAGAYSTHGVIVLDAAFRTIALDRGAEAILAGFSEHLHGERLQLPCSVVSRLRSRSAHEGAATALNINIGGRHYTCRPFVVSRPNGGERMVALCLKKDASVADAVHQIAADYRLSDREQEALIGLFMGFTRKELAAKMHISPNTVKAFVRLAMMKAGVVSRAQLFTKILDSQKF